MVHAETRARTTLQHHHKRLSYTVAGPRDAEFVVLIHPAFGDHACFTPQFDTLTARYRVAAIDLPGHGAAQHLETPTRIADTADLFTALLSKEGYARAHLVGVSLGALVAQDIAARYPNLISTLTVIGGYPIFATNPAVQRAQVLELLRLLPLLIFSMPRFRRAVVDSSTHTPQAAALFLRSAQTFTRRSLRAFAGNDALMRASPGSLSVPLQIVVGEHERQLVRAVAEDWQRREPGSVLTVIPGAGHCANMDNPGEFNARLLAFLASHRHYPDQDQPSRRHRLAEAHSQLPRS